MLRIASSLLLAFALASAAAAQPTTIELIGFAGGPNWPLWVADEKGFFTKEGLNVRFTPTPSSAFLVRGVMEGKFDIALAAIDNVIAYQEGEGEAALASAPDMFAFLGNLRGALRLVALPEIKSIADLRGKSVAVDARTTGFAFVLMKMLEVGGLTSSDYELQPVGGTTARVTALFDRTTAASLINSPLEADLLANGYSDLGSATKLIGAYQGTVGVARRSWAGAHRQMLVDFIRAYVQATDWLHDPANRDEALRIYARVTKSALETAQKAYELLLTTEDGIEAHGKIDLAGVRTVLKLRSEYGQPHRVLDDPEKYVDESYYRDAAAGR